MPDGKNTNVTLDNLDLYCRSVRQMILGDGLKVQQEALRSGFSEVLDVTKLSVFAVSELESMIRGSIERWTPAILREAIKCDHGYSTDST